MPRLFTSLLAVVGGLFGASVKSAISTPSNSSNALRDYYPEPQPQKPSKCRWGIRAVWRKFFHRRKDQIARASRNLNRRNGRTARSDAPSSQMNFARRGKTFLHRRQLRRCVA